MCDISIGRCVYCLTENIPVYSTPERESQCEDCHRLTINNCKTAIAEIQKYKSMNKAKGKPKKSLAELEKAKDDALARLMSGDFTKY